MALTVFKYLACFLQAYWLSRYNTQKKGSMRLYHPSTCELLGQGSFLITDKTGTLSDGRTMSFTCLFVNGRVYGNPGLPTQASRTPSEEVTEMKVVRMTPRRLTGFPLSRTFASKRKHSLLGDYFKRCVDHNFHLNRPAFNYVMSRFLLKSKRLQKDEPERFGRQQTFLKSVFPFPTPLPSSLKCRQYSRHRPLVPSLFNTKVYSKTLPLRKCISFTTGELYSLSSKNLSRSSSTKCFQPLPRELRHRTKLTDTQILYDRARSDSRGYAVRNILLAMTLCNSVVPTSDALMHLLCPLTRKDYRGRYLGDDRTVCGADNRRDARREPCDTVQRDDSASTSSAPDSISDEMLWTHNLEWNDDVISFLKYHVQYPEEECILAGSSSVGYRLLWRSSSLVVLEKQGKICRFEVLGSTAFDSTRQRMSIVVREENTKTAYLYSKGSDVSILPLCSSGTHYSGRHITRARRYIRWFAQNGLRTLVFARRPLSLKEQDSFQRLQTFVAAQGNRKDDIHNVMETFETNMELLGITGVREKVVPGAVDTIRNLSLAGVRVWMMTGDHSELALHIAYASKIFQPSAVVFQVHIRPQATSCPIALWKEIRSLYGRFRSLLQTRRLGEPVALLVAGPDINHFLSAADLRVVFCSMICSSDSVIFCRVSPQLKARVIRLLKDQITPSPVIFAIGDGSNDISMFQEADCGIAVTDTVHKCYAPCATSLYARAPSIKDVKALLFHYGSLFNLRVGSITCFLHYYGANFVGGYLTYTLMLGISRTETYFSPLIPIWEFIFLIWMTVVHSLTYQHINGELAQHLPLLYLLSRRETQQRRVHCMMAIAKGLVTSSLTTMLLVLPCMDTSGVHGTHLSLIDFYIDRVTCMFVTCVFHIIMETPYSSSESATALYILYLAIWYLWFVVVNDEIVSNVLLQWFFFSKDDLLHYQRDYLFWWRQPYIVLMSLTIVSSIYFLQRIVCPNISDQLLQRLHEYWVEAHHVDEEMQKESTVESSKVMTRFINLCNPLRRANIRALPPPVQHKLVYQNRYGQGLCCALPFVSDIDKLSMMIRLRHRDRVRFLEDQLEAPSFELLRMFWGQCLAINTLRKRSSTTGRCYTKRRLSQASTQEDKADTSSSHDGIEYPTHSPYSTPRQYSPPTNEHNDKPLHPRDYSPQGDEHFDPKIILRKTCHIRDALHLVNLRFRDPQLEVDYQTYRKMNEQYVHHCHAGRCDGLPCPVRCSCQPDTFVHFSSSCCCWCCYEGTTRKCTATSFPCCGRRRSSTSVGTLSSFLVDFFTVLFSFATFYSCRYSSKFNFFLRMFCITCTITKQIVHYINCDDGISFASIFSVLTFVILRIPFFYALIQNILFTVLFFIRYIFTSSRCKTDFFNIASVLNGWTDVQYKLGTAQLRRLRSVPLSRLAHYLPLFLGIQALIGFVGYRLEYNDRCGFFFTYQAQVARQKRREMLNTMLPSFVVEQYMRAAVCPKGVPVTVQPQHHKNVSVVFCDVHNFEHLITIVEPTHVIQVLDSLFLCFDKCVEYYQGAKVETVFETYLVATGLNMTDVAASETNSSHAQTAVELSLGMLDIAKCMVYTKKPSTTAQPHDECIKKPPVSKLQRIRVRIGIHSGGVISGVVGNKKPQYCLFGDTVNTASRMKSTGKPDCIHISYVTYALLKHQYRYVWEPRNIDVKGIGLVKTYLLRPQRQDLCHLRVSPPRVSSLSMFDMHSNSFFFLGFSRPYPYSVDLGSAQAVADERCNDTLSSTTLIPSSPASLVHPRQMSLASSNSCASTEYPTSLFIHLFFRTLRRCCAFFIAAIPGDIHIMAHPSSNGSNNNNNNSSNNNDNNNNQRTVYAPMSSSTTPFSSPYSEYHLSTRFLRFTNPSTEQKYRDQYYDSELNLSTIEQALVIFLILFITETWAVLHIPRQDFQNPTTMVISIYWPTRLTFCGMLLFFWWLLRHRFSFFLSKLITQRFLIGLLNLILVAGGSTIVMINVLSSVILPPTNDNYVFLEIEEITTLHNTRFLPITSHFSWFPNDVLQFFFYITILHNCSGLLFSQVIVFNVTLVSAFLIFIFFNFLHSLNSNTACISVSFLILNLISVYLKESTNRAVFVANEELRLTERRAQELLEDMLPRQILRKYQEDRLQLAYKHERMSFLFADICRFTPWAKKAEAKRVVHLLQVLFYQFDCYSSRFGLFKLCTIGDAYVAVTEPLVSKNVSNITVAQGARRILQMAHAIMISVEHVRNKKEMLDLSMRIGLHHGDCFGGLIGSGRLRYDLWGLDVITANMMETAGVSGRICVSEAFHTLISNAFPGQYQFAFHKTIEVCNKKVNCYLLLTMPPEDTQQVLSESFREAMDNSKFTTMSRLRRQYEDELNFIEQVSAVKYKIKKGFVPRMNTEGIVYVNDSLKDLLFDELRNYSSDKQHHDVTQGPNDPLQESCVGGFLPALKQVANVAGLPGIVGHSIGLPDVHSGYGFAIGNVAAFNAKDPQSVVSPGGVGFDINCGVRVIRTNLDEKDITPVKEKLVQSMFDHIPVGVGSQGILPCHQQDLDAILLLGMDWSLREGFAWPEDKEHCEEFGRLTAANPDMVSTRAKRRGLLQLGTLGAGNHYTEVQVVDEIYDVTACKRMGLERPGQVCIMIHTGSRGLGHQIATDSLIHLESQGFGIPLNDKQLICAPIHSAEGQKYLKAMAAASNFAWVNRSAITFLTRQAFAKIFNDTPDNLDMHVIYDVSHNVAKFEEHMVNGKLMELLVHRKGSTRAFPPHHPLIPIDYQFIGQPVLIGGTMGTSSYIGTGTEQGMLETFGSTCHGAGRALSRNKSRNTLGYKDVLQKLYDQGISVRVASSKLIMEEAPEAYKDVSAVVDTCHAAGIMKKCVKLRPIAVIKG